MKCVEVQFSLNPMLGWREMKAELKREEEKMT